MIFSFDSRKIIFIILTIYISLKKNQNNYNYDKIYDILPRINLNKRNKNLY